MRWLRRLAWLAGAITVALVLLFFGLQTGIGQRLLAEQLSELASSPDSRVEISRLEGFFPTDLRIGRVELADRQGTWLKAEDAALRWSFASLFTGRLRIDQLSASRLEVLRAPKSDESTSSSSGGLGLPMGIDLRALDVPDIHLGADLAGGVDSHWRLTGSTLLAADGSQSRLRIQMERTDGPAGRVVSDLTFDLRTLSANGDFLIEEPNKGGVVGAMLGRPDLQGVSAKLVARGDRNNGSAELTASAQDLLSAKGDAHWQRAGDSTRLSFKLQAQSGALGLARIETAGTYDLAADKLDATATLEQGGAGPLRKQAGGLDWRNLHLDAKTALANLRGKPTGTATVSGSADDVTFAPLAPTHVELAAKIGAQRDGRLAIESLDLSSLLANIKGTGSYMPSTENGEAKLAIDGSNLAVFSSLAGLPLQGRTHVDLTLTTRRDDLGVTWQGTIDDLNLPGMPRPLAQQNLRLSGHGLLKQDGSWQLDRARVESEPAAFDVSGHGSGDAGELALTVSLPHLEMLQPQLTGSSTVKASLAYRADETHGTVNAKGTLADHALALTADFTRKADGSLLVPAMRGHWASASVDVHDLTITPQGAKGSGHMSMSRLEDLKLLLGTDVGGSLDINVATEPDPAGKVRLVLQGERIRGQGIGIANLQVDGTVTDPLGKADTDAMVKVTGMNGAGGVSQVNASVTGNREKFSIKLDAAGPAMNASLAAEVEAVGDEIRVALQRLAGRYRNVPINLQSPIRVAVAGPRSTVQSAAFTIGGGRVTVSGALDPSNSDLTIQIAQLPLSILEALAPGTNVEGTLQARLHVRGALAQPQVQATYAANGLRLRKAQTALMPALALQGKASMVRQQATFDLALSAPGSTRVTLKGEATLPQGGAALRAKVAVQGNVELAPFAAALGNSLRGVAGTMRPDVVLSLNGDAVNGTGTIALADAALYVSDTGLRLSNGEGTIALQGDTLQLQQLTFQTARSGTISATGTVRLDHDMPIDLAVTTRKALLANRPDLIASVSSDLKVTGSPTKGLDVQGPVTIDRAEIGIGVSQAANYPVLPVHEINGTSPANGLTLPSPTPQGTTSSSSGGIRLALQVRAPQAVYVRGRGLNAEVGGQFTVNGDPSHPSVLGNLTLRHGSFNLAGHVLDFTRGNVSLVSATTIDPQLDFAATTTVESTTIEVDITGTPRAPKIVLTSSPPLPQDEAMAMLLFGKPSASLSPSEILMAAEAVSELSGGTPVASGFLGRLRNSLGLDQLSVNAPSSGNPGGSSSTSGTSLQGGRYVAPGVYVGAEQGTTTTSTRGVVDIDVFKHTKIEGAVGTDANDRIGAKMEWDY